MPTNLQLSVPNFVRSNGYFYTLDANADTLYKKVDDGANAFSYPLDTDVANPVLCLQYDNHYFYTMESTNTGNGVILIKRWLIQDFTLKLNRTYTLNGISTQKFNANTFAIENYSRTVSGTTNSGSSTITVNSNSRMQTGDILHLGPSTFTGDVGKTEDVTILNVLPGNQVTLTAPTVNSYNSTDPVYFANRCWFFNRFRPNDADPTNGNGQLFSFDLNPVSPTVVARKAGNEFRTVLASTFLRDPFYPASGREFLVYANQSNLLFIEVDPSSANFLVTVESAAQNNQDTSANVIPIQDLAFEGNTLFRLQQKATFRNGNTLTTEDWSPLYNYQLATLQRLPQSISLTATPAIISADGVSTSVITAIVTDQFANPVASRSVAFADNDTGGGSGAVSPTSNTTNSQGVASTTYTAGTTAKTVTITAST